MSDIVTATATVHDVPAGDTPAGATTGSDAIRPPDQTGRIDSFWGLDMEAAGDKNNMGSAAMTFDQKSGAPSTEDVAHAYPWTTTRVSDREDIPYIILSEHRNTESTIMRQVQFYGKGIVNTAEGVVKGGNATLLEVYDEIFPDNPTNNKYIFPYFNKSAFELSTGKWEQMDDIGQSIKDLGEGASTVLKQFALTKGLGKKLDNAMAFGSAASAAAQTALKGMYPLVGVCDRPRVFASHTDREINIEFPLYNTLAPEDWMKNYRFLYKFMSQNLFIKRDFITGIPPCFYRVLIPGQYFSFASCVTKINVEHLGNVRMMDDSYIIPDAYQVSITLSEMVMPSLNQFQALVNGDANNRVSVVTAKGAAKAKK